MRVKVLILITSLFFQRSYCQDSLINAIDQRIEILKQSKIPAIRVHQDSFSDKVASKGFDYFADSLTQLLSEVRIIQTDPNVQGRIYYFDNNQLIRADVQYPGKLIAKFYFQNNKPLDTDTTNRIVAKDIFTDAQMHLSKYRHDTGN